MRGAHSKKHLFDRLVTLHRPDCTATAGPEAAGQLRNGATVEIVESEPQLLGQALAQ